MSYDVTDIAELARHHLVFGAPDDEKANANLARLVSEIAAMATAPLWRDATWVFCDRCGTSVDTVLIHPDGHHYADDGDFLCADCWEMPTTFP
ncbi:MAG: hypothetical protein ACYCST_13120 [Acidimicrobiales bacterium]